VAVTRFAEGTKVSVDASRGEISGILAKHGVQRMAWATEPECDTLQFELAGHQYRFKIAHPAWADVEDRYVNQRTADQKVAAVDAEWRRRWRANVLLLKAKLEFAEGEASTVVRELMPYALLRDGRTLEEAIIAGDSSVPLLGTGR
jgi:cytochrome c551/c552